MGGKAQMAVAVALGWGLVTLSVMADAIGIGGYGFGWEQKCGVAVGATIVWVAVLRLAGWSPRRAHTASLPHEPSPAAAHGIAATSA
jgi:hypothetical protein